ncbi:hypothetical protein CAAN3_10S04962 [[Candida] anglica]
MESDSSQNSLGEDLDQIGRLNLTMPNINIAQYLNRPSFNLPNLPSLDMRSLPRVKSLSDEISNYISHYVGDDVTSVTSVKTAISSRIQMTNFLNDLNLGLSLSMAIDRLAPLTSIIHEAIILPVEDDEDEMEVEPTLSANGDHHQTGKTVDQFTEPVGVDLAVHRHQPLVNQLVNPEKPPLSQRHKKKRKINRKLSKATILSDDTNNSTQPGSDLDQVEELTTEEVKALTDLEDKDDFGNEVLLRNKIQHIQKLDNLSQRSKSKLVTRLMMGNYYRYVNHKLPDKVKRLVLNEEKNESAEVGEPTTELDELSEEDEISEEDIIVDEDNIDTKSTNTENITVTLNESDLIPTYFDNPFNQVMGCSHYQRNCKLECPTCHDWYTCRFCHDQDKEVGFDAHKLVRSEVKHVLCMACNTPQIPEEYCIECGIELANYFCSKCVLYDNDPTKEIYHCDKCGICRLGLGLGKDYFHCDTCNICLSIDLQERHKCLANTTHCNCPICNEYLFTSVNKVVFMKCGHSIHQNCFDELSKHSYKCPLCKKTVCDVEMQFRILDQEIVQSPLPSPYNFWRCIVSCNDCKGKSNVSYHVLGLKCEYCKSYNTNQLKLIKPEEEEEEEAADDENINNARLRDTENSMRLIGTNLQSNFRIDEQNVSTTNDEGYDDEYDTEDGHESEQEQNFVALRSLRRLRTDEAQQQPNGSYIASVLQGFINRISDERR